jgi:hypothetical protein
LYYERVGESEENLRLMRLLDDQYTLCRFMVGTFEFRKRDKNRIPDAADHPGQKPGIISTPASPDFSKFS